MQTRTPTRTPKKTLRFVRFNRELSQAALLAAVVFLSSPASGQSNELQASMRYHSGISGAKSFHSQWFEAQQMAVINVLLLWNYYHEDVSSGFILNTASSAEILSPQLPDGCELKSAKGLLVSSERDSSPVNLTLEGPACGSYVNTLKQSFIQIRYTEVKRQTNETRVPSLLLNIEDTL